MNKKMLMLPVALIGFSIVIAYTQLRSSKIQSSSTNGYEILEVQQLTPSASSVTSTDQKKQNDVEQTINDNEKLGKLINDIDNELHNSNISYEDYITRLKSFIQMLEIKFPSLMNRANLKSIALQEHRKKLGYFSKEDHLDYEHYDTETLKQLAKTGDLLAIDLLAKNATSLKLSDTYNNLAIIHGSAKAAVSLYVSQSTLYSANDVTDPKYREHVFKGLAYLKLAIKLGDKRAVRDIQYVVDNVTKINDNEWSRVNRIADNFYEQYNDSRINDYGLPPYDISVDEEISDYYDKELKGYKNLL